MNTSVILLSLLFLSSVAKCEIKSKSVGAFTFKEYKEMMGGFLLGITVEQKYLDHLLSCLTEDRSLESRFVQLMDKIDKLDFQNLPLTATLFADL